MVLGKKNPEAGNRSGFFYIGDSASLLGFFLSMRFIVGIARHPQRQRLQRVIGEVITAGGDLLRRHPANFADLFFLQGKRPVRDAAKQASPYATVLIFKIELTVIGKRYAGNP